MPNVDIRSYAQPMQPPVQQFTTWMNPTDRDVTLDLHVGSSRLNPSGRIRYVVPKKGEALVPAEFDVGIQDVRDGVIVGGLGPQLRRRGGDEFLSDALDAEKQREREAQADAERALVAKKAADEALVAAVAKQQAAGAAIAENEAASSAATKSKK